MTEHDLIGGLADVEKQLQLGNENTVKLLAVLGRIGEALAKLPAPQVTVPVADVNVTAPRVSIEPAQVHAPVTVMVPPAEDFDWVHSHQYDELGRLVRTVSTRVKGSAP